MQMIVRAGSRRAVRVGEHQQESPLKRGQAADLLDVDTIVVPPPQTSGAVSRTVSVSSQR